MLKLFIYLFWHKRNICLIAYCLSYHTKALLLHWILGECVVRYTTWSIPLTTEPEVFDISVPNFQLYLATHVIQTYSWERGRNCCLKCKIWTSQLHNDCILTIVTVTVALNCIELYSWPFVFMFHPGIRVKAPKSKLYNVDDKNSHSCKLKDDWIHSWFEWFFSPPTINCMDNTRIVFEVLYPVW